MCRIIPRIKELAEREGITIGALERLIGASKGVISRAINNGTDIQSKWLQAIVENYPQYSAQWLLTGQGEMIVNSKDHLATQSGNNKTEKLVSSTELKPSNHRSPFDHLINPDSNRKPEGLPLVSVQAVGGFTGKDFVISEHDIEAYYIIPKFRNLNVDFLIEVVGDSMMPRLFPGDIIACSIVRNPRFIQWNKTYLIATGEQGLLVKRIRKSTDADCLLAISNNSEYDPFDIPLSDISGLARVVGVIHAD